MIGYLIRIQGIYRYFLVGGGELLGNSEVCILTPCIYSIHLLSSYLFLKAARELRTEGKRQGYL